MIKQILELKQLYKAKTLKELAFYLKVPFNRVKNISSGRTKFCSLYGSANKAHTVEPDKSSELAELVGIVLGDGNIHKFKRCQRLLISCNSTDKDYIKHISFLVEKILKKKPTVKQRRNVQCTDVYVYMQRVDEALGIPAGNKIKNNVRIPKWIYKDKKCLLKCIKGLFETDGDYAFNKKHNVEFIEFSNRSERLRRSAFDALVSLGYSPQLGKRYVRLAKKREIPKFLKDIEYLNKH